MDYAAQAADVKALIERLGGSAVVLGHSMGGKVAMATALLYPELVQGLVVADIMPVEYRPSVSAMDSVHSIVRILVLDFLTSQLVFLSYFTLSPSSSYS
jgi:pimeloyl-ACP methyl ester carboxylesterase